MSPAESYEAGHGVGAYDVWGENWDYSAFKRQKGADLTVVFKYFKYGRMWRRWMQTLLRGAQWKDREQMTQVVTREILPSYEVLFWFFFLLQRWYTLEQGTREAVDSPSEIFKIQLDNTLSSKALNHINPDTQLTYCWSCRVSLCWGHYPDRHSSM